MRKTGLGERAWWLPAIPPGGLASFHQLLGPPGRKAKAGPQNGAKGLIRLSRFSGWRNQPTSTMSKKRTGRRFSVEFKARRKKGCDSRFKSDVLGGDYFTCALLHRVMPLSRRCHRTQARQPMPCWPVTIQQKESCGENQLR